MGFSPISHRLGAIVFLLIFLSGIPGAIFAPQDYMMACIGSMLWVLAKFSYAKDLDDKAGKDFDYIKYGDAEWDNISINAIGIFVIVPEMHDIVGVVTKETEATVEFTDLWYYAAGIISDLFYIAVLKVAALKRKYEGQP